MELCLCNTVRQLAREYEDGKAQSLISALNCHMRDLRAILAQSKSLARSVQYQVTLNNQRTMKALFVNSINLEPINTICEKFKDDVDGFWTASDDVVHLSLCRRLACVVIFLGSRLDVEVPVLRRVTVLLQNNQNVAELRNSGRKYIKLARKLGGLGALFWLPLDIPHSTYERYLNMQDEEVLDHLQSLRPRDEHYAKFVQRLILSQFNHLSLPSPYHNLFVDYNDFIPYSDQLLLLLHAFGGSIPDRLLRSFGHPQRRWNDHGEIESRGLSSAGLDLPAGLGELLSNETELTRALEGPYITKHVMDNGNISWTLCPELRLFFSNTLRPHTIDELEAATLKVLCFACPPCYEGNTEWSTSLKQVIWPVLESIAKPNKVQEPLRTQALETILYFCERDSVPIRQMALRKAKTFLRKSMPYYLQASVVVFQSILYRLDGELTKSEAEIRNFLWQGPKPKTRRDVAIQGRLHISQIENKIKCYDKDVPSFIYKWEAEAPLSALDTEVTSRLQSAAARFFQSVGDFGAARASLEQFLSLNTANPLRANTRRIISGRLADIYCEMEEYERAAEIIQLELDRTEEPERARRSYRRLLSASVEANIGLKRLDAAEVVLKELEVAVPPELDDLYDQQLHVRSLLASARLAHLRCDYGEAVLRWRHTLQEARHMYTLKSQSRFIEAMVHLSMAHAQIATEDRASGWHSWTAGIDILRKEKCEFWIPIVPTLWLRKIFTEIYESQGWSFRMMLPNGKPDITWP